MLSLLFALGLQRHAQAQGLGRENTVLLTVAAPAQEAQALEAVARELLERLSMQVELRRVERIALHEVRQPLPSELSFFARVWIAFSKSGSARLYLEHSARDRVLVRDVLPNSSNPELVREELGHILQAGIEGLRAGEEIGVPRREALQQPEDGELPAARPDSTKSPVPTRPAPSAQRRPGYHFGPRYEVVWLGDGAAFDDGPGAAFAATLPVAGERAGIELLALYRRPLKLDTAPVGAEIQTFALRGLATFELWRSGPGLLRLGVGGGPDFVRVSPFAGTGQDVQLANSQWLKFATGRVTLSYARALASFIALELTVGVDIDANGTRYVFQRSSSEVDVLRPSALRPLVSLGASVP